MNFLKLLTTTLTISLTICALGFPVLAGANVLDCEFSDWATSTGFTKFNCSSTMIGFINATDTTSTFALNKSWSYEGLLLVFFVVLIMFFGVALRIFNFFFPPVFKIREKK